MNICNFCLLETLSVTLSVTFPMNKLIISLCNIIRKEIFYILQTLAKLSELFPLFYSKINKRAWDSSTQILSSFDSFTIFFLQAKLIPSVDIPRVNLLLHVL